GLWIRTAVGTDQLLVEIKDVPGRTRRHGHQLLQLLDGDAVQDDAGVPLVDGLPFAGQQKRPPALEVHDAGDRPASKHLLERAIADLEMAVASRPAWPCCRFVMNVPLVYPLAAGSAVCPPRAPNAASKIGVAAWPGRPVLAKLLTPAAWLMARFR